VIPYSALEQRLIDAVDSYVKLLISLEVFPPYAVFLSLLNVRGYFMPTEPRVIGGLSISRDHLYIPEAVFDSVPDSVATAMFPVFNSVWNACGFPQSLNFDRNGRWLSRA